MDWLNNLGLSPQLQAIATLAFVIALAVFAAWSRTLGKRDAVKPEVREFGITGQFTDMGPVKELVKVVGELLVEQRADTVAHRQFVDLVAAYLADLRAERAEREADEAIEERAQQIADRMIKAMKKPAPRRRAARKPASSSG